MPRRYTEYPGDFKDEPRSLAGRLTTLARAKSNTAEVWLLQARVSRLESHHEPKFIVAGVGFDPKPGRKPATTPQLAKFYNTGSLME